jgi:flagellar P-ring protein precursor FlgI
MRLWLTLLAATASLWAVETATRPSGVRIKDLASIEGVRDNQLVGYGLVVGLNQTGDKRQTIFSAQTLANLLQRMGVQVVPSAIQVRNTAAVMVTADLPPFAQPGTRIDVTVAAVGDATALQGGLLVLTPLKASNGATFAVAQGQVVTGGFLAQGGANNSMTVNHPTAGRIPGGAIVEQGAPSVLAADRIRLQLRNADFTTATRLAVAINKQYGAPVARCENSALVGVEIPAAFSGRIVEFLAEVESLTVETDRKARVIINERTGTIVLGRDVRIRPVAVLHGALSVEIQTTYEVSQPAPFHNRGQTAVVPEVGVGVKEEKARQLSLKPGATVEDLVRSLMNIGSTPRDVIAILQSLRSAGALEADLEVI